MALQLAQRHGLSISDTKVLVAAAMLHDAAIPPYGHLVEDEFKNAGFEFRHEKRVAQLIKGTVNAQNKYLAILPGKSLQVSEILDKYNVDPDKVIGAIRPTGMRTAISADIDLDNIDNVHRMAIMLGWNNARENTDRIMNGAILHSIGPMTYHERAVPSLENWLDFRQRIYTLIIAHPECIPYNALQVDLVRLAVSEHIISPDEWWLSEPEFEDAMRRNEATKGLAMQLIAGCDYQLVDYAWLKHFDAYGKANNAEITNWMLSNINIPAGYGYFVWNERKLISRQVQVTDDTGRSRGIGENSTSCMIALIKKTIGRPKWTKAQSFEWRQQVVTHFARLFDVHDFEVDFPETYTGNFRGRNSELNFGY